MSEKAKSEMIELIGVFMDAQTRYASILEEGLGKPAYEHWIEGRFFKPHEKDYTFPMQIGKFGSVKWFFHGLEVDLVDRATDFRIRIDFGPAGRLDCFTVSGIQEMLSNEWIARRVSECTGIYSTE